MSIVSFEYGDFLKQYKWNYLATIRPNYMLNEIKAERIGKNLLGNYKINKVFYSVEKDINDNWYHMHLLIDSFNITKKEIAKNLGWNDEKIIGYLDKIEDKSAVSHYCAKRVGKSALCHNFMIK